LFNRINKHLAFKITREDNNRINFLDLTIIRNKNNIEVNIYRKETSTDTVIHYFSNHPIEQKMAAFRYYINRLLTLPLTQDGTNTEWTTILNMAKNNGFPIERITRLKTQMVKNLQHKKPENNTKRWTTFTYYGPAVRKITNLFKYSAIGIAFRTTNTIFKQLTKGKNEQTTPSGIYKIKCNTCNTVYMGQTGRGINTRYKEHIRYIKSNNPQSAYAIHILRNRHEYGPENETLQLIRPCAKGTRMNSWEAMMIQYHHHRESLITEQQPYDHNPLYICIQESRSQTDYRSTIATRPATDTSTRHADIT